MIIINKASIWDNDTVPVEGAVRVEKQFEDTSFTITYWTINLTVEEAITKYGKSVVSYNKEEQMFSVLIYDDYIE